MPIDADIIDTYFTQGFACVPQVFTPAEMDQISAAFDRVYAHARRLLDDGLVAADQTFLKDGGSNFKYVPNAAGGFDVQFVSWCPGIEPVLDRYGEDARLLDIAAALLGAPEMDHLICQAHFKQPGSVVQFPWHQDATHRGMQAGRFEDINGKGSFVQMALALDDMTEDNGPLMFIPESWKLGHLPIKNNGYGEIEDGHFDPATAVTPMLKRGDVALFGPYTIHGSVPNRSPNARRVFINGFAYPGANKVVYDGRGAGRRVKR